MGEILEIFKAYNGSGYYCILFIISLIYLWFVEEDRRIRALLVYTPAVIQVLFFIPLFFVVYNVLDEGTYYRILWLLPMTVVIAYAGCKIIGMHTKAGLAILSFILVLSGSYVYRNANITRAENAYHIPQECVEICEMIKPEAGKERVWAAFPVDMVHYVRQYTSDIQMPYGRDLLFGDWNVVPNMVYEEYKKTVMDAETLSDVATEYYCNYIILRKDQVMTGQLDEYDVIKIGETENYNVYRNNKVEFWD